MGTYAEVGSSKGKNRGGGEIRNLNVGYLLIENRYSNSLAAMNYACLCVFCATGVLGYLSGKGSD